MSKIIALLLLSTTLCGCVAPNFRTVAQLRADGEFCSVSINPAAGVASQDGACPTSKVR